MLQIGAIVMASGDSVRFGGHNKLLADFHGKPLCCYALDAISAADFARRLVVTRNAEVAALAKERGFEVLLHALPDVSDTIRLGTQALLQMDGLMYCVGDQPFLSGATIGKLLAAFAKDPSRIYRAGFGGREGNPVLFPKALLKPLCALAPGQTGSTVIRANRELVTVLNAGSKLELADIDTEDDYLRYAKEK